MIISIMKLFYIKSKKAISERAVGLICRIGIEGENDDARRRLLTRMKYRRRKIYISTPLICSMKIMKLLEMIEAR